MQAGAEHEVSLQQGLGADENVGDLLLNGIHAKNVGESRREGNSFFVGGNYHPDFHRRPQRTQRIRVGLVFSALSAASCKMIRWFGLSVFRFCA
jgi:hypothetical protein